MNGYLPLHYLNADHDYDMFSKELLAQWRWFMEPKDINKGEYEKLGKEIGALVDKKQLEYGDSFGRAGGVLRILYPNGVEPSRYGDLLAVARIIDKLFRIAVSAETDEESPYMDIAGYGLLGARASTKVHSKVDYAYKDSGPEERVRISAKEVQEVMDENDRLEKEWPSNRERDDA